MTESLDRFDKFMQAIHGLPDVRESSPSTVNDTHPLTGQTTTHIVQTFRQGSEGITITIQRIDAEGAYRYVVPPKVAAAIYRQRDRLMDRSTPESRARDRAKREREKQRRERDARKATRAARQKAPAEGPPRPANEQIPPLREGESAVYAIRNARRWPREQGGPS